MKKIFWILAMAVAMAGAQEDSVSDINKQMNQIREQVSANTKQVEQIRNEMNELNNKVQRVADTLQYKEKFLGLHEETLAFKLSFATALITVLGLFISFFGIGVPILGFIYGRNKSKELDDKQERAKEKIDELKGKIDELKNDAEKRIDKLIDNSEKKIDKYAEEAKIKVQNIGNNIIDIGEKINDIMENRSLDFEIERKELEKKIEEIIEISKTNTYEQHLAITTKYYLLDDYKKVLSNYEDILAKYKSKITVSHLLQIYLQMAYSYSKIAESEKSETLFKEAEDKYKEVLKLDPQNTKAYNNLGTIFVRQAILKDEKEEIENLLKKAMDKYDMVLEKDNKYANAYNNRGSVFVRQSYLKTKDEKEKKMLLDQAEEDCLRCMKLGGVVYNLACVYALKYGLNENSSDKDNAFKYLKEALENKEQSFEYVKKEKDFESIRNDPQFKELENKYGQ